MDENNYIVQSLTEKAYQSDDFKTPRAKMTLTRSATMKKAGGNPFLAGLDSTRRIFLCHRIITKNRSRLPKSGQSVSTIWISVSWWHCQRRKSLNRLTPDVRTRMSTGGSPAVYIRAVSESVVMLAGEVLLSQHCCAVARTALAISSREVYAMHKFSVLLFQRLVSDFAFSINSFVVSFSLSVRPSTLKVHSYRSASPPGRIHSMI